MEARALKYVLVVLTHDRSPHLGAVLDAYEALVRPEPLEVRIYCDGPDMGRQAFEAARGRGWEWSLATTRQPRGFCVATAEAWADVVGLCNHDYVFWLENDFVVQRPVDLEAIALVLRSYPHMAQMALCRNAVNEAELAAGGLVESRPGEFRPGRWLGGWLEQTSYFTTNPSLMTAEFMAAHPFHGHVAECEGRFGLALRELGYCFGLWGNGEPWVEHVGERTGFGY